jgi:hypothetical protein
MRDLLATQTWRAPPATVGKADVLWLQRLAAVAQEVGELLTAALAGARELTKLPLAVVSVLRERRGWHLFYQDKPFSTTWISSVAQSSCEYNAEQRCGPAASRTAGFLPDKRRAVQNSGARPS